MELLVKILNCYLPLAIFRKSYLLDVWQGPEYASEPVYSAIEKSSFFGIFLEFRAVLRYFKDFW